MTSGNCPDCSSCLAYAVRPSAVGDTSRLTLMSGYLSVTRLIAASQYCGVRLGVSKVRKLISFFAPVLDGLLPVSFTVHALSVRAAASAVARNLLRMEAITSDLSPRCQRRV